ncbi:dimethylglycine dehydrogenase [Jannaschia pagri]|uniref:Dimethylglycine dehydrogenase n=1 Tax=Jannaschia pagri TaxID=2829797 RepID=A0ABQ4NS11_9RHOB|nr:MULTISPECIES: FAD-dependent oxidoreductase [unclassified Jannaschia]GIT93047.1 dimethylglycine dehydrogenase [Jannaschia sp. AI_61]GIT96882.1 dimethylglycine dehydrogenase [Jannaschia sp. AI_62]
MTFPEKARVVIIGGGAVGVSSLYHLALEGWTDCVLLERNELTAGSTWHAAGNCPNFAGSWAVMNIQRYSMALYRELAERVDYPMNYHVSGTIRYAHSQERMEEFEHVRAMGDIQGLKMTRMTLDEMKEKYPIGETHDLVGGLWDPEDGDIDPAQLTQALAKGARDLGARIIRHCPVTGVTRDGEGWIVHSEQGDIACDYVVNAAGYYAARVAEWFEPYGRPPLPMVVMSHQYLLTEPIPEIEAWSKEHGGKLPMVRDPDISYYLRQEKTGLNLGPYERNCQSVWTNGDMPEDFSFQLWQEDLDRIEDYIADAMERVPSLATAGVSSVINGPIPYSPDGLPLIGPMPGVKNAFDANVFTFGIAQGGGAGKVLADWIVKGAPDWDCFDVDPRRFAAWCSDPAFCKAKAEEVYGHEYGMHFPHMRWPAGKDMLTSPNHEALQAQGAQMAPYGGWERATWFAKEGDDTSFESTQTWKREGPWHKRVAEEVAAVRDGTGVLDLSGFSRFELSGEGAAEWLSGQIAGRLPKVGRMTLCYFNGPTGKFATEMSVSRWDEDRFTLITAAAARAHDHDLLAHPLAEGLTLTDTSESMSCLLVTGPTSRDILAPLTEGDLSASWLSVQETTVCGKEVRLQRVSFAGELGWEVHGARDDMPAIYAALMETEAVPFGMFALDTMRIEKGYRAWGSDLSPGYTLREVGADRFIRKDERGEDPARCLHVLTLDDMGYDPLPMSPIRQDGEIVGEITSAAFGHRVGKPIAMAMLPRGSEGQTVEVEVFGHKVTAAVHADGALWDSENERIRA